MQGRILRIKTNLTKLNLISYNGNMNMRYQKTNDFLTRKSESRIANAKNNFIKHQFLDKFCEKAQAQKVSEQANTLLNFFITKSGRLSGWIQKIFALNKLIEVILTYRLMTNGIKKIPYKNLYKFVCNPCFLLFVYSKIRKKMFNTIGHTKNKHKKIFNELYILAKKLSSGQYNLTFNRGLWINELQKKKKFIKIGTIGNQILQKSFLMLMEPVFEFPCNNYFYPFYFKKDPYISFKTINKSTHKTFWFINLNTGKAYKNVHSFLIIEELKTKITDQKMLKLAKKMLEIEKISLNEIINYFSKGETKTAGTNIYFKLFFVKILCSRFDRWVEISVLAKSDIKSQKHIFIWKHFKIIKNQQLSVDCEENKRILFEIKKKRSLENKIKFALTKKLKIQINFKQYQMKCYFMDIFFLKYLLFSSYNSKLCYRYKKINIKWHNFSIKELLKVHRRKGFFQLAKKRGKRIKFVARRVDKWIFLRNDFQVVQKFNLAMKSMAISYCMINHFSILYKLWKLFRRSLALTLAHRHKQQTAKAGFSKWGYDFVISFQPQKESDTKSKEVKFQIPNISLKRFKYFLAFKKSFFWSMQLKKLQKIYFFNLLENIIYNYKFTCFISHCSKINIIWHHMIVCKKIIYKDNGIAGTIYNIHWIPVCLNHHKLIIENEFKFSFLKKLQQIFL